MFVFFYFYVIICFTCTTWGMGGYNIQDSLYSCGEKRSRPKNTHHIFLESHDNFFVVKYTKYLLTNVMICDIINIKGWYNKQHEDI